MGAVSVNNKVPSASLLAGNVGFLTGFEHIESVTVGSGGASSVTFSGIPQYYRHLQIRAIGRTTSGTYTNTYIRFNGDSGSNYAFHQLYGNSASALSSSSTSQTQMLVLAQAGGSGLASTFGSAVIDILDYANTVKNKTVRSLTGIDQNYTGSIGLIELNSGLWMSTAPVASIVLNPDSAFVQHSTFSLYGIR